MIIKDEKTGEDITVFSQEELEEKIQEKGQEYEVKIEDAKKELDTATEEKKELEKKIEEISADGGEGKGEDSKNFSILKAKLTEKENDIKELKENNQKISNLRLEDIKSEILNRYSKNDEELRKMINFHYDSTLKAVSAESKEDIAKKMENAYKLSKKEDTVNLASQMNYQAGAAATGGGASAENTDVDPRLKNLGNKMGISDEDWKKFSSK